MKSLLKRCLGIIVAVLFSVICVVSPIAFLHGPQAFELIKSRGVSAVGDAMNPFATAVLFFCSGGIIRGLLPKSWVSSIALLIAIFPMFVLAEVVSGVGHHNLFPFEILIYVIVGLPSFAGTGLVSMIRHLRTND
jgi:hypothetical protein